MMATKRRSDVKTYEPRIRLYVDAALAAGERISLAQNQAHYLRDVLRQNPGDAVAVFNGRDGEWRAVIESAGKRQTDLTIDEQLAPQAATPDIWLAFAPIKRARIDILVEKATELGVSRLIPVVTRRTNVERVNTGRLRAIAVEAAEQTGRLTIPEIDEPTPFASLMATWPAERRLYGMDETGGGRPVLQAMTEEMVGEDGVSTRPCAILIGPEGGFAEEELVTIRSLPFVVTVTLGPRILRSDTAALAALACWQAAAGDWRGIVGGTQRGK
jgi:16S rRNA (uracil1498-N3)-methyltransferase